MHVMSSLLTVFTATSALVLACGLPTDVRLWWQSHDCRKVCVASAVNWGPPSDVSSLAAPTLEKNISEMLDETSGGSVLPKNYRPIRISVNNHQVIFTHVGEIIGT